MSEAYQQAIGYFRNATDDSWRWAENGRVLVWSDGTTIAFREELADILELLAVNGLPPFHAVVVLLAALRGKFPQAAATGMGADGPANPPVLLAAQPSPKQLLLQAWNDPANQEFSEFIAQLRQLQQLPAELRNTPRAKANIIEVIFEVARERWIAPARAMVSELREGLMPLAALNETGRSGVEHSSTEQFLKYRLGQLSPEALASRLSTGLDVLPDPAELDLKPAERIRQLLAQMQADPEHQGLAKVTRDVMAALYMPRSLSEMDELALGGFSDISNRGNLDRLLPSELAHDDLTLSVRIALNEALYFRREPPANHPPGQFAVLIDAGVRMWGLPRLFATAVALALLGKDEREGEVTAWRAGQMMAEKIDLLTRRGLTAHLSAMESYRHCGAALKYFLAQFKDAPDVEAVLITQRDTLADPDFNNLLQDLNCPKFYIATIDRDGSFELFLHPHRQSLLCQAAIPLESLFTQPRRESAPLRKPDWNPDLPLILSIYPFPILLPVIGKIEKSINYSTNGGIAAMKNRRLLRWETQRKGAESVIPDLPKGTTLWLGTNDFGKRIHVLKQRGAQGQATLTTWNSVTNSVITRDLQIPHPGVQAWARGGLLYLHARSTISGINLESGEPLGSSTFPGTTLPANRRYFLQADGTWRFVTYDGHGFRVEPVSLDSKVSQNGILALFDRDGYEGPWVLTKRGEVFSNEGKRVINLGRMLTRFEISPEGDFIAVPGIGNTTDFQCIELREMRCTIRPELQAKKRLYSPVIAPTANLRVRFEHIHLPVIGGIFLCDIKSGWWKLEQNQRDSILLQQIKPNAADIAGARHFESLSVSSTDTYTLKMAAWPDGRRAWLDSRGLLHLRNNDAARTEICIVLADGPTAVWSSDAEMCGAPFFIPTEARTISTSAMMQKIHSFNPGG